MVFKTVMGASDIENPLVSVIIPAHNSERFICKTIESVLSQTHKNIEIIIVDDGSVDSTVTKVKETFSDGRILLICGPNKGASAARNFGFQKSKGTLIKFLDSDDLINPEMLSRQVAMSVKNPKCIISGEWGRFYHDDITTFKSNPEPCWQSMDSIDWICTSWANTSSMTNPGIFLIPRQIIEHGGLWDEKLSLLDDADFFARAILSSEKVIFTSGSVLYYRSGIPSSLSSLKSDKGFQSMYSAFEQTIATITDRRYDAVTRQLSADMLQLFIYSAYPNCPELIKKAEERIKDLAKPTLGFQAGPYGKALARVVGWKLVKRLMLKNRK